MKPTLELILMFVSLASFLSGLIMWYGGKVQKSYAAQRDFEHLKRNYSQLAENQAAIMREFDKRCDQIDMALLETKGMINGLQTQVLAEHSQGWRRRD